MVSKLAAAIVILLILAALVYAGPRLFQAGNESTSASSSVTTKATPESPLPNATLYKDIVRNIQNDSRISGNKTELTKLAVQLFTDLHYGTGLVRVLDPKTGNYVSKYLSEPTIQAITNYSVALSNGLPKHSNDDLFLLGNASQIDQTIVDATPIIVPTAYGSFAIPVTDLPSFYWMLADQLKLSPSVVAHPEMYLEINSKNRAEESAYVNQLKLSPANQTVRDLIKANWFYHYNATPQEGNTSKRITVFPWYNETLMSQWFPNKVDRQLIEWGMWLPVQMVWYDVKIGNRSNDALHTVKDNLDLMINGSHFGSFNGTLYDRIMAAWNDKKLNSYNIYNRTDNWLARAYWNGRNGGNGLGPYDPLQDLAPQFSAFGLHYKPLINETSPINKLGFAYGLAVLDEAVRNEPEQHDVLGSPIYASALGGALFDEIISRLDPAFAGFYHQTIAIPIPEYLASKLPSDTIYGLGHTVSIVSSESANMQNKPPIIMAFLPNTYGSNGIIMKRY